MSSRPPRADVQYAELHCLSNFSFLRGASHPAELVATAAELGYVGLALTDECSVAGVVRAHGAAKKSGLKLVVGSEIELADGLEVVVLAVDRKSYGALCRLISRARRATEKGSYLASREDLADCLADSRCVILWVPDEHRAERAALHADGGWLAERFGDRVWLAAELLRGGNDRRLLAEWRAAGRELGLPLVAAGNVLMHTRERRMLQDTLTAIRLKTPLDKLGFALAPNAERCLRPLEELARRYPPELLRETLAILERVDFSLDELRYEYPHELVPDGETPTSHLRKLTVCGEHWRWPGGTPPEVRARIEHELDADRRASLRGLFPDRPRRGSRGAQDGHLVPGQGLGREFRRLLLPRDHRGGSGADADARRALHLQGAQRAARHRRGFRARAPRGGHPVHLPQVFARARGARRDRDQLSAAQRDSRRRQGARIRGRPDRRRRALLALVGRRADRARAGRRDRASIPRARGFVSGSTSSTR